MVWSRTILDGIVVCLIFNVTVSLLWMMVPNAFSKMLPAEIRKASPKRRAKDILILASVLYPWFYAGDRKKARHDDSRHGAL